MAENKRKKKKHAKQLHMVKQEKPLLSFYEQTVERLIR